MTDYTPYIITLMKCLGAILAGILLGNGAVYFFNKMPAKWFCDYGETPSAELRDPYTQRIKSNPWKFVFTMFFVAIGVYMVVNDWRFAIAALLAIWLMVEMSIGDIKYGIVPDQLVILLAVSALGFIAYHGSWKDCVYGALIGFGVMGFMALLGKLMYKKDAVGGGDIKLFASLGLLAGVYGILAIFVMTTIFSAGHFIWLLLRKKAKRTDSRPMVPYATLATIIYLVFLWGRLELWLTL
ncbi:prepilin peptidase [Aminicella lysinilytica]|uniref:prepilin peptidase n=1 Tax=Aminicella lysinilytica TaxID=433323 RepID=UPI0026F316C5|nr:A24 family peptidase [Aminicella lysinilytica]